MIQNNIHYHWPNLYFVLNNLHTILKNVQKWFNVMLSEKSRLSECRTNIFTKKSVNIFSEEYGLILLSPWKLPEFLIIIVSVYLTKSGQLFINLKVTYGSHWVQGHRWFLNCQSTQHPAAHLSTENNWVLAGHVSPGFFSISPKGLGMRLKCTVAMFYIYKISAGNHIAL